MFEISLEIIYLNLKKKIINGDCRCARITGWGELMEGHIAEVKGVDWQKMDDLRMIGRLVKSWMKFFFSFMCRAAFHGAYSHTRVSGTCGDNGWRPRKPYEQQEKERSGCAWGGFTYRRLLTEDIYIYMEDIYYFNRLSIVYLCEGFYNFSKVCSPTDFALNIST